MIKLEHVNKVFNKHKKNRLNVINDTSLEFDNTGLIAILGPSGCGKTTLLNVIGGLDNVGSGKIYVNGKRITRVFTRKKDEIRNLNIGYIFQDYKLLDNLSVFDNVAIVLKMLGIKDKSEIENRVLYTLEKVNMLRYKKRPVTMLSGGERQRVAIARALVKNPKIIIADEPTGNLDSRNSIEIMNIIKKISNDRLVILVTHEEELAKFYATRIIELLDGKVINDYVNKENRVLDYRIDNKLYLKDFKEHTKLKKNDINIDVYSNDEEKIKIDLVFSNGNIYIKTNSLNKIELVENNIELIDEHYKVEEDPTKFIDDYDILSVSNNKYKEKYSSIYRLGSFIKDGFKSILDYSLLKKLLLGGFFLSGIFIFYAISSSFATLNIEDKDFITMNKNYLIADVKRMDVEDYLMFENDPNTVYMLPSNSIITLNLKYDKFYQTLNFTDILEGSLSSIELISSDNLVYGRMPLNKNEIVIDKMVAKNVLKKGMVNQIGIKKEEDFTKLDVVHDLIGEFKIVGITDLQSPSIYAYNEIFINLINNGDSREYIAEEDDGMTIRLIDYQINKNNYKLTKGRLPINDYEILINENHQYNIPINQKVEMKVNGKKLKVVGYYSTENDNYFDVYITNQNTIKYSLIKEANNIVIYSKDENTTKNLFLDKKIKVTSAYDNNKKQYIEDNEDYLRTTILVCSIMLFISLLEIFLIIRSSFLSRVKEVGTLRAIGIKKSDIYKMFSGEIIAITMVASVTGILFMSYILYNLSQIEFISNLFMVNGITIITSIILVFIFNLIVGLIPVYNTMRKTPSQILSRHDIN